MSPAVSACRNDLESPRQFSGERIAVTFSLRQDASYSSLNSAELASRRMQQNGRAAVRGCEARSPAPEERTRWLRWKTPLFLVLVIFSNLAGDVCLRFGLREAGNLLVQSPRVYVHVIFTPWVGVGVAFYLIWMLAQMALFSWADLSYVVPITAVGYALAAVAGRLFFGEFISSMRWLGISFIVFGVILVTRTRARTTDSQKGNNKL